MIHWLQSLLAHQGYWVIFLVVFLNNLCLPVPGDTILLAGGFLAGKGSLALWIVVATGTAACFLGGTCAYGLGFKYGRSLLRKISWMEISPQRIKRVEIFFERNGAKAVFIARFVALLHPVTGLLAGMWKTPFRPFLFYNLAGAFAYSLIYTCVGLFFGDRWEIFKSWLGPMALYILLIVAALLVLGLFLRRSIRAFFKSISPEKKTRKKDALKKIGTAHSAKNFSGGRIKGP